jgi:hypothetical protein
MPAAMDDGKYDDVVGRRAEIDRVREASHECAAHLTLDARIRERFLEDPGKRPVDLRGKGAAKPGTLALVPVTCIQELGLRLRAEN